MGLTQNLGRLSPSIFTDSSLNIGIGAAPSGTYKFEVTGTAKISGVATFGSTLSNGTYNYTLPSATGTLALTSAIPANPVGGTGTTNYLPKFTGTSTIGNSTMQDDGTNVSITGGFTANSFLRVFKNGSDSLGSGPFMALYNAGGTATIIQQLNASNGLDWWTTFGKLMTLTSTGNLGLGVTPSAWGAFKPSLQVGTASLSQIANRLYLTANGYYSGSAWTYIDNDYSTQYFQQNGQHIWNTAPIGTGTITFTQAMTLTASGQLGIGIIAPSASLHVSGNIYATQGSNYQAPDVDCLLYLAGEDSTKRRLEIDAYSVNGPVIKGRQSNGTFSSPLPTLLDNTLLFINATGSEIVAPATTASFISGFLGYQRLNAAENFTPSSRGTYWDWGVIPIGSIALTTSLMQLRTTGLTVNAPIMGTAFNNTALTAYAKLIPSTAFSKKIVVFGSSVALGVGATGLQGWAYKLGQTLIAEGWTYTNISIGGNNTIDLINRFYTDLVPLQPDVVVIGLSLANEGILNPSGKEAIFNQYIDNMYQLVDMCRQQGFKVIVTGCYPNNDYTSVEYNYCKQADKFLQTSQIPYINFLGSVDNGSGNWRTGMFADAGHPNDTGHESMYRAIPISLFDRVPYSIEDYSLDYPPASAIQLTGDTVTSSPIVYTVGTEVIGSWTIMMNVKYIIGSPKGVALIAIYNGTANPLRLRAPSNFYELAATGSLIMSTVNPGSEYQNQIAITYDYYTDTVQLYIDGVSYGSAITGGFGANPTSFSIFGRPDAVSVNANGFQVSNIAIYKVALNQTQISECYRGFYPKSSLQIFSPCTDAVLTTGSSLLNIAPSSAKLIIQSPNVTNSGNAVTLLSNLTAIGSATIPAFIANNITGASGTAQYYIDFIGGETNFGRILRGNDAAGYEANGLNIDNYAGMQIKLNALGGSGGAFNVTGGAATFSGNVGIGAAPSYALDIYKSSASLRIYDTSNPSALATYSKDLGLILTSYYSASGSPYTRTADIVSNADAAAESQMRFFTAIAGSNPAERMRITSGGVLQVANASGTLGTLVGSERLNVNGTIYAYGDVVASSDISVKNNIRPISNALDKVINSRGVVYDRTDTNDKDNIGFIAQELELQFPELVITGENGKKGVKYQNAVAVLFEAIKEQQLQIEELKTLIHGFTK